MTASAALVTRWDDGAVAANAKSPDLWAADRVTALDEIRDWMASAPSSMFERPARTRAATESLTALFQYHNLCEALLARPASLSFLRAMTRRDIGASQFATFIDITDANLRAFERGGPRRAEEIARKAASLIDIEADLGIAPWFETWTEPTAEQVFLVANIIADRMIRRNDATVLRYAHEPRQLVKIAAHLDSLGYTEILKDSRRRPVINEPRDLTPGTYRKHVNIEGATGGGSKLIQSVDMMVRPLDCAPDSFPVFIEAKAMTDVANANKRQKEESQKRGALRRRWCADEDHLFFILLLGGTVPVRYLEVEADEGLDWVWEHRVEDIGAILADAGQRPVKGVV